MWLYVYSTKYPLFLVFRQNIVYETFKHKFAVTAVIYIKIMGFEGKNMEQRRKASPLKNTLLTADSANCRNNDSYCFLALTFVFIGILSSRTLQNNLFDLYSVEICHNKVLFSAKATTNPSCIGIHFLSFPKIIA